MAKRQRRAATREPAKSTREKTGTRKKGAESPAPKGPRSQSLPGMRQVRYTFLDHRAERMNEIRKKKNLLILEEAGELKRTLRYMHDNKINFYKYAGVEFERVPGEEKLRCHTSKETATEMMPPEAQLEPGAEPPAETPGAGGDEGWQPEP